MSATVCNQRSPPPNQPVAPPASTSENSSYAFLPQDENCILQSSSNLAIELQRIAFLFQGTSFISEAEFVINCKTIMNLLQYPYSEDMKTWELGSLVEIVENAVITFIVRVLPSVFQQLITPTSLLHPISPPMVISLLEVADLHVHEFGDFSLQLRMAAIHQLLRDNGDVALAFSMCQTLPRILPNSKWQPVMNPVKAHPVLNFHGSISLPEIHPLVFPPSPSLCASPMLSSIPSLSSLLNCTTSSSMSNHGIHPLIPNHTNTIRESISQPTITLEHKDHSSLTCSSSAPNLQHVPLPKDSITSIAPPVIACEDHSFEADTSIQELFSSSHCSSSLEDCDPRSTLIGDLTNVPEIHIQLPSVNENPAPSPHDAPTYPSIISIVSEDDLSRLISCTDVAEGPLSPSLFTPDPDSHSPAMDADITISIGQSPLDDTLAAPGSSKNDSMHLSPLFSHTSSPLSSPSKIVINQGRENNFLNTFEIEVQKRPPSPYNKRLRSASNNPQPTMKRAQPSVRTVSACSRRNVPLDSDLAALTLPPPPKRKTVDVWDLDAVVGQQRGRRFGKANKAKRITDGSERDRGASSSRQQYGRRRASANQKLVDKEN